MMRLRATWLLAAFVLVIGFNFAKSTIINRDITEVEQGIGQIRHMETNGDGSNADRTSWPELVGQDKDAAKAYLEQTTTKRVYLVPFDAMVTMDWSSDRVRIRYDPATGKVVDTPTIG